MRSELRSPQAPVSVGVGVTVAGAAQVPRGQSEASTQANPSKSPPAHALPVAAHTDPGQCASRRHAAPLVLPAAHSSREPTQAPPLQLNVRSQQSPAALLRAFRSACRCASGSHNHSDSAAISFTERSGRDRCCAKRCVNSSAASPAIARGSRRSRAVPRRHPFDGIEQNERLCGDRHHLLRAAPTGIANDAALHGIEISLLIGNQLAPTTNARAQVRIVAGVMQQPQLESAQECRGRGATLQLLQPLVQQTRRPRDRLRLLRSTDRSARSGSCRRRTCSALQSAAGRCSKSQLSMNTSPGAGTRAIVDTDAGERIQAVGEPPPRVLRPLGNAGQLARVIRQEGDDLVRLAVGTGPQDDRLTRLRWLTERRKPFRHNLDKGRGRS